MIKKDPIKKRKPKNFDVFFKDSQNSDLELTNPTFSISHKSIEEHSLEASPYI